MRRLQKRGRLFYDKYLVNNWHCGIMCIMCTSDHPDNNCIDHIKTDEKRSPTVPPFAKELIRIIMSEPLMIVLAILIFITALPILAFIIIRPDGRYHCHEPGCGKSFGTMDEILRHLGDDHNYDSTSIAQIVSEFNTLRS